MNAHYQVVFDVKCPCRGFSNKSGANVCWMLYSVTFATRFYYYMIGHTMYLANHENPMIGWCELSDLSIIAVAWLAGKCCFSFEKSMYKIQMTLFHYMYLCMCAAQYLFSTFEGRHKCRANVHLCW